MSAGIAFLPYRPSRRVRRVGSYSAQRHVCPFQWFAAPPIPSPGRKASIRRTGSADDYGALFHCRRHDTSLLSAEVLDCLRVLGPWVWFATEVHHISRVCGGKAGIADHLPKHLAVIAAIHRIGNTGLREQWVDE